VLEVWLDLESLKDSASNEIPGFNDRLRTWMPSLIEHRCSVGERGGFYQRLERGTYMAHIFEHIVLELQTLAGTEVGFGRTRMANADGVYKVALEYEVEELCRAAIEVGKAFCLAAVHDQPFDTDAEVQKLRAVYEKHKPKPLTAAITRAAKRRDIPVRKLDEAGTLLQLGHGASQRRVLDGQTDRSSAVGNSISSDRELTRTMLQAMGVPIAQGAPVHSADDAWSWAEYLGLPCMVRPRYVAGGDAILGPLNSRDEVTNAYNQAATEGWTPMVEQYVAGDRHRLLVIGKKVVATDSSSVDVTTLHPDLIARAIDSVSALNLEIASVEVLALNLARSLEEQSGCVLGVSGQPNLNAFASISEAVGEAIVEAVFPNGETGRIPIIAVTGTNGKTTTTRLIAHLLRGRYGSVAMTCTEGIHINDRRIMTGDCSGPQSARMVLQHPESKAAVIETARGGILRAGLGYDACDVAVVTNIGKGDHLGLNDIDTLEQLVWVKSTIVWAVTPTGTAVLNANDPHVVSMAQFARGKVTYFALDENNPIIVEHTKSGGTAVFVRDGHIIVHEGKQETILINLTQVPLTHGGRVSFQVENCLSSVAAARAVGLSFDEIRQGLKSFDPFLSQVPGRFNLLDLNGVTVVVDYGHNTSALDATLAILSQFPHDRRSVVYSAAGDRRNIDILEQGEQLGNFFDRAYIYEDAYIRGRKPGEITELFREGLSKGSRIKEIHGVQGGNAAIELALSSSVAGDLLLVQPDVIDTAVELLKNLMAHGGREMNLDEALACPFVSSVAMATTETTEEPIELRDCPLGQGAFTERAIKKGEVLYRGWAETTEERSKYTIQVDHDLHLVTPSPLKFLNHSCDPNCGVLIRSDYAEIELHALRAIPEGEELTLDYETFETEFVTLTGPCLCGTAKCRGRLRGYSSMPLQCRKAYGVYVAEYLRKSDAPVLVGAGSESAER